MTGPPPCHSEARTPKNLRCLLTRSLVVGMDQSSEADLRFLTPFGMTEGAFGMTGPPPCHSEARTPKNLRCLLTRRLVVVMDMASEPDIRFLTAVRNDSGSIRKDRGAELQWEHSE